MFVIQKKIFSLLTIWLIIGVGFLLVITLNRAPTSKQIVIGAKDFTEQQILGELMAILIEETTDLQVKRQFNLSGTLICFTALQSGDIDVYPEYTGTGIAEILKDPMIFDPEKSYEFVKKAFLSKYQIEWLKPFGFMDGYVLLMRKEEKARLNLSDASSFSAYLKKGGKLKAGIEPEVFNRPEYHHFLKTYAIKFTKKPMLMDFSLLYLALKNGSIDFTIGLSTDARNDLYNLAVLKDNKHAFPSYLAAPIARQDILLKHPEVKTALNSLSQLISDEEIRKLNGEVDVQRKDPYLVAYDFLVEKKLISRKH
ncbi:MAG: hypothetical protein KAR79_02110 [Simkaniaceae bacterium]|nr:hypothetical protein [Simkaniaceae bacterium]